MTTTIGTEEDLDRFRAHLVEIDFDATDANRVAIERLEDSHAKDELAKFEQDPSVTRELGEILRERGETPTQKGNATAGPRAP